MSELAKYIVRSPKQVLSYFKLLKSERCLISAAFGVSDKDTFLTAILDIDEKNQTLTIDCGPKEYLNKKLLDSAIIKCSTEYQGIKVMFEGRRFKKAGTSNNPAFIIPIPKSIFWVQRRQFYRVKSPLSKDSYCAFTLTDPKTKADNTIKLKLNDISISGLAFLNQSRSVSNHFQIGGEVTDCKLVLENETEFTVDLEVRHKTPHTPKIQRIGCYISNVTPRVESMILRYMQNIEREIKQKAM